MPRGVLDLPRKEKVDPSFALMRGRVGSFRRPPPSQERRRGLGHILPREPGGFRASILNAIGLIRVDRKVRFRLGDNAPPADIYKWKVKNDDNSPQPRGEITDHQTKNDPEETKYNGHHFVECYAIRDGVCIGRGRQNVVLQW